MKILPEILKRGHLGNFETIEQKKRAYIMASNPITEFIKEHCKVGENEFCSYNKFYMEYCKYLSNHKIRRIKTPEFRAALENEGFYIERTSKRGFEENEWKNGNWIIGLNLCVTCVNLQPKGSWENIYKDQVQSATQNVQNTQKTIEKYTEEDNSISIIDKIYEDVKKSGKDNKNIISDMYSPEIIQNMLNHGELFESPPGTLRVT